MTILAFYLPNDSLRWKRGLSRRVTLSWRRGPCASFIPGVCLSRRRGLYTAEDGRTTSDRKAFGAPDSHSFRGEAAP